jgi:membrane protease YdiL (CAAX protease family)
MLDERESTTDEIAAPPPLPVPVAPEPSPVRTIVAWLAIAICVGVIASSEGQTPASRDDNNTAMALRSLGRTAVGIHRLFSGVTVKTPSTENLTETLEAQLDLAASRPVDRVHILPAIAELRGADAVIERLDKLELPPNDPDVAKDAELLRLIYAGGVEELDTGDRAWLKRRMGWFGQLALTWGLPESDPSRRAALAPATRTAVASLVWVPLALFGAATGFMLLVIAATRLREGKLISAGARALAGKSGSGLLVEGFAIYLASFVVIQALSRLYSGGLFSILWMALYALAPLACLWPLTQGMRFAELRARLGWHTGRGFFREIGWGFVGYVAGIPIMGVGIILTLALSRLGNVQPTHPISDWIAWDFWRVAALLALAAVYAPLAEETMFRGALYSGVRGKRTAIASAFIVAFVFAAIHPQGWVGIPVLMSLAIVFALLREWRGSLIAPITAHAINNTVVVFVVALAAG